MTTTLSVRDTIYTYLDSNWTSTPIDTPNRSFDPEAEAPNGYWISPRIIWGTTFEEEKGTGAVGLRYGILRIFVYCPKDAGHRVGISYATSLEGMLRRSDTLSGLSFGEPNVDEDGLDEETDRFVFRVDIPFTCFIDT